MNNKTQYEKAHAKFLESHLAGRTGERRDRLERGHQHAERTFCEHVWWPLQANFDHLHPEYEVLDWRSQRYFCDFVWIKSDTKIAIEIKGYGSHIQDMDRRKFCQELNRETFLTAMGFQVVSFAYDDVAQRPELCQTLLRMVLARFGGGAQNSNTEISNEHIGEVSLIRFAYTLGRPVRAIDLQNQFGLGYRASIKLMRLMCEKRFFEEVRGKTERYIVGYRLRSEALGKL